MEELFGTWQLLAGALRLPVSLYKNGSLIFPPDGRLATVSSEVLGEDPIQDIARSRSLHGVVQHVDTPYKECFVYLSGLPNYELFIGPVLLEPILEGYASELIRTLKLPLRRKGALVEFYAGLPVVGQDGYYYIGKLVERLLATGGEESVPAPRAQAAPEPVFSARGDLVRQFELFEHPPYFMELEMTRLITTGDVEGALRTLARINDFRRAVLAGDEVRSLKNSLICNCAIFARAAIAGGISPDRAFLLSDQHINQIERATGLEQLVALERQTVAEFVGLVHDFNTARYSAPVREVMGYIDYHLAEKLPLEQLAERVFLNPNYLSSLFHKETGLTIRQYILHRRLEEAKFLLRYTSNSVMDIAEFYQFCSQSHFTKCFRDHTGQTPLQYRKSIGEGGTAE